MSENTKLYDVFARFAKDSAYVFQLRAPLPVVARLFELSEGACQRVDLELASNDACELFSNRRSHGAWGILGGRLGVHSVKVCKTDHVILK